MHKYYCMLARTLYVLHTIRLVHVPLKSQFYSEYLSSHSTIYGGCSVHDPITSEPLLISATAKLPAIIKINVHVYYNSCRHLVAP